MGSMSMGGLPPLAYFPQYYWAVVGTVVAIATLINVYNHLLYRQRYAARYPFSSQLTPVGSLLRGQADYNQRNLSHGLLGGMQQRSRSCGKHPTSQYGYPPRIAY